MTHAQQHRQKSRNAIVIIIKMIKQKNGFFGEKEREMRAALLYRVKEKGKVWYHVSGSGDFMELM
jgi:hypothetical protein